MLAIGAGGVEVDNDIGGLAYSSKTTVLNDQRHDQVAVAIEAKPICQSPIGRIAKAITEPIQTAAIDPARGTQKSTKPVKPARSTKPRDKPYPIATPGAIETMAIMAKIDNAMVRKLSTGAAATKQSAHKRIAMGTR